MFFDQIVKLEKEINNSKLYREQSCVFLGQNFKILKWGLSWDILGAKSGQCYDILRFICVRMLHKISRFETYGPKCRIKSDLWIRASNSVRYVCILWVSYWLIRQMLYNSIYYFSNLQKERFAGMEMQAQGKTFFVMDWHLRHFLKFANLAAGHFWGGKLLEIFPTPGQRLKFHTLEKSRIFVEICKICKHARSSAGRKALTYSQLSCLPRTRKKLLEDKKAFTFPPTPTSPGSTKSFW